MLKELRALCFLASTLNSFCFIGNAIYQQLSSEVHLEPIQASMMLLFAKIGNGF